MDENIKIYTENKIVLSECPESPDTMDIEFKICDFDFNLNGYKIDRDNIENWVHTLEYKPIVGKIAKIPYRQEEDFTSHQAKKVPLKDENGNIVKDDKGKVIYITELNTDAFGTFYEVGIKYDEDEEKEIIYAKGKVWKRFKKAIEILQRRIDNGEKIASSWEVNITLKEEVDDNGKKGWNILDGYFIGHCILGYDEKTGTRVYGAYPVSEVVEVAELKNDLDIQLSEALIEDTKNIEKEENNKGGQIMSKIVLSSLTNRDISKLVRDAIWESKAYGWEYDIVFLYPKEDRVIIHKYGDVDNKFTEMNYSINEEDSSVTFTNEKEVEMVFQPKTTVDTQVSQIATLTTDKQNLENDIKSKDTEISELNNKIATKDTEISQLNNTIKEKETELSNKLSSIVDLGKTISGHEATISELNETIKEKDTELSELQGYKVELDKINAEKEALELSQKREEFKNTYLNTGLINESDLEVSEVKEAIEKMDDNAMKVIIAEKVIKQNANKKPETKVSEKEQVTEPVIETNVSSVQINDDECVFLKTFRK